MQVFRDTTSLPGPFPRTVLTIGNFDGVHLGHQMIIRDVVARARAVNGTSALMTFDPPPTRVLGKRFVPRILSLDDRIRLVEALGVDVFICQTFSAELAGMEPTAFMRDILHRHIDPQGILIGYDFCFGRERKGNFALLKEYFEPLGREVVQFSALTRADGETSEIVSSSQVRQRVSAGELEQARQLLGRPYFIRGVVVRGDARGRTIGFPTANLKTESELVPPLGVYATRLELPDGRLLDSVTNIGRRPTFEGQAVTIETHVLDFSGELYDLPVRLELHARIRDEQRFDGVLALIAQIRQDVKQARSLLGAVG